MSSTNTHASQTEGQTDVNANAILARLGFQLGNHPARQSFSADYNPPVRESFGAANNEPARQLFSA